MDFSNVEVKEEHTEEEEDFSAENVRWQVFGEWSDTDTDTEGRDPNVLRAQQVQEQDHTLADVEMEIKTEPPDDSDAVGSTGDKSGTGEMRGATKSNPDVVPSKALLKKTDKKVSVEVARERAKLPVSTSEKMVTDSTSKPGILKRATSSSLAGAGGNKVIRVVCNTKSIDQLRSRDPSKPVMIVVGDSQRKMVQHPMTATPAKVVVLSTSQPKQSLTTGSKQTFTGYVPRSVSNQPSGRTTHENSAVQHITQPNNAEMKVLNVPSSVLELPTTTGVHQISSPQAPASGTLTAGNPVQHRLVKALPPPSDKTATSDHQLFLQVPRTNKPKTIVVARAAKNVNQLENAPKSSAPAVYNASLPTIASTTSNAEKGIVSKVMTTPYMPVKPKIWKISKPIKDLWTELMSQAQKQGLLVNSGGPHDSTASDVRCIKILCELLTNKLYRLTQSTRKSQEHEGHVSGEEGTDDDTTANAQDKPTTEDVGNENTTVTVSDGDDNSDISDSPKSQQKCIPTHDLSGGLLYESCSCPAVSKADLEERKLWMSFWREEKVVFKLSYLGIIRFMNSNVFTFEKGDRIFMNLGELFWRALLPRRLSEFQTVVEALDEIPEAIPKTEICTANMNEACFIHQFIGEAYMTFTMITPYALRLIYERLGELHGVEKWQVYSQALFYKQRLGHQCPWTLLVTPPTGSRPPKGVPGADPEFGQIATKKLYKVKNPGSRGQCTKAQICKELRDGGAGTSLELKGLSSSLNQALTQVIATWQLDSLVKPFCCCDLNLSDSESFQPLTFDNVPLTHITEMKFLELDSLHCWKRCCGLYVSLLELRLWAMLPPVGHKELEDLLSHAKEEEVAQMLQTETIFLSQYGYMPEDLEDDVEVQENKGDVSGSGSCSSEMSSCSVAVDKSAGGGSKEKTMLLSLHFLNKIYHVLAQTDATYVPHSEGIFYIKHWLHDCPKETENLDNMDFKIQDVRSLQNESLDAASMCKAAVDPLDAVEAAEDEDLVSSLPIIFQSSLTSADHAENDTSANYLEDVDASEAGKETLQCVEKVDDSDSKSAPAEPPDEDSDENSNDSVGEDDISFKMYAFPHTCSCPVSEHAFLPLRIYSIKQSYGPTTKFEPMIILDHIGQAVVDGNILYTFKKDKLIFFSVADLQMQSIVKKTVRFKQLSGRVPDMWWRMVETHERDFLEHQGIEIPASSMVAKVMISAELLCFLSYNANITYRTRLKQADIHLHQIGHVCPDSSTLAHKILSEYIDTDLVLSAWEKSRAIRKKADTILKNSEADAAIEIEALTKVKHMLEPTCSLMRPEEDEKEDEIMLEVDECVLKLKRYLETKRRRGPVSDSDTCDTEYYICSPSAGLKPASINRIIPGKEQKKASEKLDGDYDSSVFFGAMIPKVVPHPDCVDMKGCAFITESQVLSLIGQRCQAYHLVMVGSLRLWGRTFCILKVNGKIYLNWSQCALKLIGINTVYALAHKMRINFYKVPTTVILHLSGIYSKMNNPWLSVDDLTAIYWLGITDRHNLTMFPKTFSLLWRLFVEAAQEKFQFRSFILLPKLSCSETTSFFPHIVHVEPSFIVVSNGSSVSFSTPQGP